MIAVDYSWEKMRTVKINGERWQIIEKCRSVGDYHKSLPKFIEKLISWLKLIKVKNSWERWLNICKKW